jgi:ligand-binding SRPBCC domain-containing protein
MDPRRGTEWSTARSESARPEGLLHAGQRVYFSSRAFGRHWRAITTVTRVTPERHSVDVDVSVPFEIINHEHLSLMSLPDGRTQVQFG